MIQLTHTTWDIRSCGLLAATVGDALHGWLRRRRWIEGLGADLKVQSKLLSLCLRPLVPATTLLVPSFAHCLSRPQSWSQRRLSHHRWLGLRGRSQSLSFSLMLPTRCLCPELRLPVTLNPKAAFTRLTPLLGYTLPLARPFLSHTLSGVSLSFWLEFCFYRLCC